MPRRLHPSPGLVVGQILGKALRRSQVLERLLVLPPAVAHLAVQHPRRDGEDVDAGVVEHGARGRHPRGRGLEPLAFRFGRRDVLQHRVREPLGVVEHGGGRAVERPILGQRHGDDLAPPPEADGRVHLHRHEALQPVRHRRALHPEHGLRNDIQDALGGPHRGSVLSEEHRTVEHEVVVVRERHRVPDPGLAVAPEQLVVGGARARIPVDRRLVVPALDVDVSRHVQQVAGVGHQIAQAVGRAQRPFRMRGHLQGVDVHVQQAGMVRLPRGLPRRDGVFEHPERLDGVRSLGRLARLEVPQGPGRAVHERLGEQRAHVGVARERSVHLAHRAGVVVVPPAEVAVRLRRRVPPRERLDEGPLDRGRAPDAIERLPDGVPNRAQRGPEVHRIEFLPRLVVVGPGGVPDPPPRHRAAGVVLGRPPEAVHRLLVGEGVAPHETPVEPALRLRRSRRYRERAGSEIEIVVSAHSLLSFGTRRARIARIRAGPEIAPSHVRRRESVDIETRDDPPVPVQQ